LSFVTKLFVVLLVVCSLMLSAAVVVFVNRVDNYEGASKKLNSDVTMYRTQANSMQSRLSEVDTAMRTAAAGAAAREGELSRNLTDLQKQNQDLQGRLAQAQKDLQVAQGTINGTASLARAAQEENKGLLTLGNDLRTKNDDLLRANGELNTALTVKDNQNRALARQLEFEQERVVELQHQAQNAPKQGSSEASPTPPAPIAGRVNSVDIIGGKKYATISVGSADNVQKGMRFNVINTKTGEFLGFLTVDRVEPNEAIGPVEGTKIDKVQTGVEVRTQL